MQPAHFVRAARDIQGSLDLAAGPLLRGVWIDLPDGGARLLLVIHHLAVDGVSWRVLLEDLETAGRQIAAGGAVLLPPKTTSFQSWAERLAGHARSMPVEPELSWWQGEVAGLAAGEAAVLPLDFPASANTEASLRSVSSRLSAEETKALLQEVPAAYRTQINDVLLTALTLALAGPGRSVVVDLEGHGREEIFAGVDLSRTVGWFTTLFPVRLTAGAQGDLGATLKSVKEHLRALPRRGIGFGLLRHLRGDAQVAAGLAGGGSPEVSFNYFGQLDQALPGDAWLTGAVEPVGPTRSPRALRHHTLDVTGAVAGGRLSIDWSYSANLHRAETVEAMAGRFLDSLRALIAHCRDVLSRGIAGYTPSDFSLAGLDSAGLEGLLGDQRGIEDLYPLSPVQEGLLFHSLYAPGSGVYVDQVGATLRGDLGPDAIEAACRRLVAGHPVLRTSFHWRELDRPLQAVHARVMAPMASVPSGSSRMPASGASR